MYTKIQTLVIWCFRPRFNPNHPDPSFLTAPGLICLPSHQLQRQTMVYLCFYRHAGPRPLLNPFLPRLPDFSFPRVPTHARQPCSIFAPTPQPMESQTPSHFTDFRSRHLKNYLLTPLMSFCMAILPFDFSPSFLASRAAEKAYAATPQAPKAATQRCSSFHL